MTILDDCETSPGIHLEALPPTWPVLKYQTAMAQSLLADNELWHAIGSRFTLPIQPAHLSLECGVRIDFKFLGGECSVWLESNGSPFVDAICADLEPPSGVWLQACVQACWGDCFKELSLLEIISTGNRPPPDLNSNGWQIGACNVGVIASDLCFISSISKVFLRSFRIDRLVKIPTRLQIWQVYWPISHLRTLAVGDAVVLPLSLEGGLCIWWCGIGYEYGWKGGVNLMDDNLTLSHLVGQEDASGLMPNSGIDGDLTVLGQIRIPVTFELDAGNIRINELIDLKPGRIFELSVSPMECRVNLMSNGHCLAHGRIVQIGQKLSVAIDRIGLIAEEGDS